MRNVSTNAPILGKNSEIAEANLRSINMDAIKLYATPGAKALGTRVAGHLQIPLGEVYSEKFSDGELFVRFDESVRGQTVFLLSKINMPYEHFFEMLMTVDAARRSSAREVVLIVPYLPHSRQERRDGQ